MIIYVDIDETLCTGGTADDYSKAKPIDDAIDIINKIYDKGHKIIIWTARGTITGKSWKNVTKRQLREWGVKYHQLKFNKPFFDFMIDDKSLTMTECKKYCKEGEKDE